MKRQSAPASYLSLGRIARAPAGEDGAQQLTWCVNGGASLQACRGTPLRPPARAHSTGSLDDRPKLSHVADADTAENAELLRATRRALAALRPAVNRRPGSLGESMIEAR